MHGFELVYFDQSLSDVTEAISAQRWPVINFAEYPGMARPGVRTVWVVKDEDQARQWPLEGLSDELVMVVKKLNEDDLPTEAWVWLKQKQLL